MADARPVEVIAAVDSAGCLALVDTETGQLVGRPIRRLSTEQVRWLRRQGDLRPKAVTR